MRRSATRRYAYPAKPLVMEGSAAEAVACKLLGGLLDYHPIHRSEGFHISSLRAFGPGGGQVLRVVHVAARASLRYIGKSSNVMKVVLLCEK